VTPPAGEVVRSLTGLLVRPRLWRPAARLVPPAWWRRWPPLPLPGADYTRFRMETMYGGDRSFRAEDLIEYLEWCRRMGTRAR